MTEPMNEAEIVRTTLDLLAEHGIRGWTVKVNGRMTRAYGMCDFGKREIRISRALAAINTAERTLDTIRHEVAHAIAGPGTGHGPQWRWACRQTGAQPRQCFTAADTVIVEKNYRYDGLCSACGQKVANRRIPPLRRVFHRPTMCPNKSAGMGWIKWHDRQGQYEPVMTKGELPHG